jgi:hypothetical protein
VLSDRGHRQPGGPAPFDPEQAVDAYEALLEGVR